MNFLPVDFALPVHKSWALGWTLDLLDGGFVWPVHLNRPYLLLPAQSTWQLSPLGLPSPVWSSSLCHPTCLIYNISLWEYSSMIFLLAFSGIFQCFVMGSNLCFIFFNFLHNWVLHFIFLMLIFHLDFVITVPYIFQQLVLFCGIQDMLCYICSPIGVLKSPPSGHCHVLHVFHFIFLCAKRL